MTRRLVYGGALIAFLAGKCLPCYHARPISHTKSLTACALTLTSIIVPRWISWDSETVRLSPSSSSQQPLTDSSLSAQRAADSLHLRSPSPLFLSHKNLRTLSPRRGLPWRPILLFDVALCRLPYIIRNCHRGHDTYYVHCHSGRRQAKERIRVEDIGWTALSLRGCAVRWDGNNSEYLGGGLRRGDLEEFCMDPLM